jgi:hypothetical protein
MKLDFTLMLPIDVKAEQLSNSLVMLELLKPVKSKEHIEVALVHPLKHWLILVTSLIFAPITSRSLA